MTTQDPSLQSQNPLSQAQASADTASRAIDHAASHPTAQTINEAGNALDAAEHAAAQARLAEIENPQAASEVEDQVQRMKQTLADVSSDSQS